MEKRVVKIQSDMFEETVAFYRRWFGSGCKKLAEDRISVNGDFCRDRDIEITVCREDEHPDQVTDLIIPLAAIPLEELREEMIREGLSVTEIEGTDFIRQCFYTEDPNGIRLRIRRLIFI